MTSESFSSFQKKGDENMKLERKSDILVVEEKKEAIVRIAESPNTKGEPFDVIQKKSNKTKGTYDTFKLYVLHDKIFKEVPNLFQKDLNLLIDSYGTETSAWIGKPASIRCKQEGEYFRYKIDSYKEFDIEEEIKEK